MEIALGKARVVMTWLRAQPQARSATRCGADDSRHSEPQQILACSRSFSEAAPDAGDFDLREFAPALSKRAARGPKPCEWPASHRRMSCVGNGQATARSPRGAIAMPAARDGPIAISHNGARGADARALSIDDPAYGGIL